MWRGVSQRERGERVLAERTAHGSWKGLGDRGAERESQCGRNTESKLCEKNLQRWAGLGNLDKDFGLYPRNDGKILEGF